MRSCKFLIPLHEVRGFAGGVDLLGVDLGRVHGFGALDLSTGLFNGVHIKGKDFETGNFVCSAKQSWKHTSHSAGICVMGLALDVPYALEESSSASHCICGLQWYKVSDLHEQHFGGSSGERRQTFLLLVEVATLGMGQWSCFTR